MGKGQIFEALQTTVHQKLNDLIVIMDHNKIQSSQYVKKIIDLKDLKSKIQSFGWHVERCDGHNFKKLDHIFSKFKKIRDKPKFLIADTIKGKGVDFMEHPNVMKKNKYYNWHAGAPNDKDFFKAQNLILKRINNLIVKGKLNSLDVFNITPEQLTNKSIEIH